MEVLAPQSTDVFDHVGNIDLWKLHKTAFLCSRRVPAAQVLKCYDWAIAMREAGTCVMLGAHSQLEKDVLHYLLKGAQPIILAWARGLKKRLEPELAHDVARGRLLLVAPFAERDSRVTTETALQRNRFMLEHAASITVGHVTDGGSLNRSLHNVRKPVVHL